MEEHRNITLKCAVCGNENFEYDEVKFESIDVADEMKCTLCNKVYLREELVDVNSILIENAGKEVAEELLKKELKKMGFKLK